MEKDQTRFLIKIFNTLWSPFNTALKIGGHKRVYNVYCKIGSVYKWVLPIKCNFNKDMNLNIQMKNCI